MGGTFAAVFESDSSGSKKSGLNRRTFLQRTAATLAAFGLAEIAVNGDFLPQTKDYSQALAQTTGRKLALLIGIDQYPDGVVPDDQQNGTQLEGCVTDVNLQKALLIHRFGFAPDDIRILTNEQATRSGICQAIESHLIEQAQPKDVVVVQFSGYGAQVRVVGGSGGQSVVRSLVPYDGQLPTEREPALNDLLESELKALLQQIKTKNITTILDAGFTGDPMPLSGGLKARSRSAIATGEPPEALPLLIAKRLEPDNTPFPGLLLRAAAIDDVVVERRWADFAAGAFTYVLTQQLWTTARTQTAEAIARSQETLIRWGGSNQQPVLFGAGKRAEQQSIYQTPPVENSRGEGVVTDLDNERKRASLWLGGLPPRVLEYLEAGAVLTCGGRRLEVRSRQELTATARLADDAKNTGAPLQVGKPVIEKVRVIPKKLNLVVAIDSQLERIERVDATSALSSLAFVSSTSDTHLPADCLLAKPLSATSETLTASTRPVVLSQINDQADNQANSQALSSGQSSVEAVPEQESAPEAAPELPGEKGYGLYSLTRSLIPGTLARQDEAIKPAISRLTDKLQTLMALKLLRLSENRSNSDLAVRVVLEQVTDKGSTNLISRQTLTAQQQSDKAQARRSIPEVMQGSRIRYRLFNDGETPLYYTLFNVDAEERISAFCPLPPDTTSSDIAANQPVPDNPLPTLAPNSSLSIPAADRDWPIDTPIGAVETYIVCSTRPLTGTIELLRAARRSGSQRINPMPEPMEVMRSLLSDLDIGSDPDLYSLDMGQWTTLNFTYKAVST